MDGSKWRNTLKLATAFAVAGDILGNVRISISVRSTQSQLPMVAMVYDSEYDSLSKVKKLFPYLEPSGTTPEGLAFEAIQGMLAESSHDLDSYFINISDGQPYFANHEWSYEGDSAAQHTRKQVKNMQKRGIKVLSYFVTNQRRGQSYDEEVFKAMYGSTAEIINVEELNSVARTFNRLMTTK
jgi:nitric oxide reductase activation protein